MNDLQRLLKEHIPMDEDGKRAWQQVQSLLDNVLRLQAMLLAVESQARTSAKDLCDIMEKYK